MTTQVELLSPKPGDYLIFYIDVGKMRPQRAAEYLERIKSELGERIDEDDGVKHIFLARPELGGTKVATMSIDEMRERVVEHDKSMFIDGIKGAIKEIEDYPTNKYG